MKKALFLCSSPKKNGNTNKFVKIISLYFQKAGICTEVIDISKIKHKTNGCIDCGACQKSTGFVCAIKDETSEILKKIPSFDYLILATPIYFMGPNAQLKLVLDRMQSLYKFEDNKKNCISHMKLGLIATAGGGMDLGLSLLNETLKTLCKYTKIPFCSFLVPNIKNYDTNSVKSKKDITDFVTHFEP